MNIKLLASELAQILPQTTGASGRMTLGKTQLEALAQKAGSEVAEIAQKVLSKIENPSVEVAYKAKSNYAIAGIRVKDGKTVVGQGAVSVTNPGHSDSVVKHRASIGENGKIASSNGFIDGGQPADAKDVAVSTSRKGGKVTADISSGKAFAVHTQLNEDASVDIAKQLGADDLLRDYVKSTKSLQNSLDRFMGDARTVLRGDSTAAKPKPKVLIEAYQKPIKDASQKIEYFSENFAKEYPKWHSI